MITNALYGSNLNKRLSVPFLNLCKILENHCGPNASFACLTTEDGVGIDFTFTKDGISIVRALNVKRNTMDDVIHSMVAYVGQRVDNACHDGTTTAMMYFSRVAHSLLTDNRVTDLVADNTRKAQKSLIQAIEHVYSYLEKCSKDTDKFVKKSLNEKKRRYWLAYNQAMISSKGNVSLSKAVADMISKVPVEKLFQIIDIRNEEYENLNEKSVTSEELKGIQIQFKGFIPPSLYNADLSTKYIGKNADLWVTEDNVDSDMPFYQEITDLVDYHKAVDAPDPKNDIVIACPRVAPQVLILADKYNQVMAGKGLSQRLVIVQHQDFAKPSSRYVFRAIAAVSDSPTTTEANLKFVKISDVDITIDRRYVTVTNLYKKKYTGIYNPLYKSKTNVHYNKFVQDLENLIEKTLKSYNENTLTKNEISDIISLYRQMICTSHVWIMLRGTSQDVITMKSESVDTVGAAISAVTDGYVFGGFERIVAVPLTGNKEVDLFVNILSEEAKHVKKIVSKLPIDVVSLTTDVVNHYAIQVDGTETNVTSNNVFDQEIVLIQPLVGFKALTDRMTEVLPKLMATSIFIGDLETQNATV